MASESERQGGGRLTHGVGLPLRRMPYWFIIILIFFLVTFYTIFSSEDYRDTLSFIAEGLVFTILITVIGYAIALVVGLVIGLGRVSRNPVIYTLATLYVEVFRGVPMLVIIYYARFVIVPWVATDLLNQPQILRNDLLIGAIPLALGYAAYMAEIYRAGIESVERGQNEAARSLGMSHVQTMRYIVLPQAIRRILPPMGNEFIAMLKDSSLLSAIGVPELTYWGRNRIAATYNTFLGWNTVAFLYLILSLILSLGVKWIERRSGSGHH